MGNDVRRASPKRSANLFVLTGAPGSGKTTILDHVGVDVRRVGEPAREILAEHRSIGGTGTADIAPSRFLELLLRRSIDKHQAAMGWDGSTVFDWGIPDCVAYAVRLGTDPAPSVLAAEAYRYEDEVLVLEPWQDIYTVDDERTMSFDDTVDFHIALLDAYERAGYALVTVPRGSVADRAAFVRTFVTRGPR